MSNTLTGGSIVWNLDVDSSKLSGGLDSARSSVESASKDIAKSSNTATSGIDKLKDSLNNAEGASKAFAGMIATVATGLAAATGFAIKSASDMENLRISLDVMTGSAENGEKVFKDLYDFAAKTPFETSDLAKATQTMLGFGISSEDVMGNLKMLGDVSMGNKDKLGSLTLAFSQITSTGRLMGQDLLQLINAGFNPLTIISQKTGKSMTELKDEMSKGAISAEMVTDAFKTATS
ncbi:MAG: tape measure protein [Bacteroidia bacterium]|nr:tape measure protein [Bacteroidia bacterium]